MKFDIFKNCKDKQVKGYLLLKNRLAFVKYSLADEPTYFILHQDGSFSQYDFKIFEDDIVRPFNDDDKVVISFGDK